MTNIKEIYKNRRISEICKNKIKKRTKIKNVSKT